LAVANTGTVKLTASHVDAMELQSASRSYQKFGPEGAAATSATPSGE
jgi:hypothetical protein